MAQKKRNIKCSFENEINELDEVIKQILIMMCTF